MIWRISGLYEADPDLRRDLHQEILLAVWRALPRFREASGIRTYIARIAHNRAISHVAKEVRQPSPVELDANWVSDQPSPEARAGSALRQDRLMRAVRALPITQRQPVSLTLEGFKPAEIADILGVSPNAVSIRLNRAKAALKEFFAHD